MSMKYIGDSAAKCHDIHCDIHFGTGQKTRIKFDFKAK